MCVRFTDFFGRAGQGAVGFEKIRATGMTYAAFSCGVGTPCEE